MFQDYNNLRIRQNKLVLLGLVMELYLVFEFVWVFELESQYSLEYLFVFEFVWVFELVSQYLRGYLLM